MSKKDMSKKDKVEMINIRTLQYKGEELLVIGAFSHSKRNYITIDIKDSTGRPYTICDSKDIYYDKIKTIKVPASEQFEIRTTGTTA